MSSCVGTDSSILDTIWTPSWTATWTWAWNVPNRSCPVAACPGLCGFAAFMKKQGREHESDEKKAAEGTGTRDR